MVGRISKPLSAEGNQHLTRLPGARDLLIAWKDFSTATEPEPTITLSIVLASTTTRKFLPGNDPKDLLGSPFQGKCGTR